MATRIRMHKMDHKLTVVIFAVLCSRITCIPLLAEMMETNPSPESQQLKDTKAAKARTSSMSKPAPKLAAMPNNFMGAVDNMLTKVQPSSAKRDQGLGILDNPQIAKQLNALLGSKPMNGGGLFSTFANPAFAAQLNKMFNSLPLGSMTSMKFLNNPLMGKQQGGIQTLSQVSFPKRNMPNKPSVTVQENLLAVKTGKPSNQVGPSKAPAAKKKQRLPPPPPKLPQSSPKLPPPPSKLPVSLPASSDTFPVSSAKETAPLTDPLLLEAGMTDPIPKPPIIAPLPGKHKHVHATFDKSVLSGFDKPLEKIGLETGIGKQEVESKLGPVQGFNVKVKDISPKVFQTSTKGFGQVSKRNHGSVQDPLSEMMTPGVAFGTRAIKQQTQHAEIGAALNEMTKMINPQIPLDGSTMDWNTSPVGTSLPSGVMGMSGDTAPAGMTWLNSGGVGMSKEIGPIGSSLMSSSDNKPRFEGAARKSKLPLNALRLKKDLGTLVGEAGPNYTEKKPTPKKTVCKKKDLYAICNLIGNPSKPVYMNVTGILYLRQKVTRRCKYDWLNIQVDISDVPMNDGTLFHGMHIHEFGEMTNGCEGMGPHYNPTNTPHGAPWQPERLRHVGDLGNVRQRRRDGKIYTRIVDYVAQLDGPLSIIGRGIALKTARDDLGQGKGDSSKVTGNSGDMMACCVISRSRPHSDDLYTLY